MNWYKKANNPDKQQFLEVFIDQYPQYKNFRVANDAEEILFRRRTNSYVILLAVNSETGEWIEKNPFSELYDTRYIRFGIPGQNYKTTVHYSGYLDNVVGDYPDYSFYNMGIELSNPKTLELIDKIRNYNGILADDLHEIIESQNWENIDEQNLRASIQGLIDDSLLTTEEHNKLSEEFGWGGLSFMLE